MELMINRSSIVYYWHSLIKHSCNYLFVKEFQSFLLRRVKVRWRGFTRGCFAGRARSEDVDYFGRAMPGRNDDLFQNHQLAAGGAD